MILSFLEIICMSLFLSIFAFYPAGNYMFKVNIETLGQGVKYVQS